jgi:hypothetical protein
VSSSNEPDDVRRKILQRRAVFVAAAVAAVAGGCENPSVPAIQKDTVPGLAGKTAPADAEVLPADAGPPAHPTSVIPCLSPPLPKMDAGPRPIACLKVAAPKDAGST